MGEQDTEDQGLDIPVIQHNINPGSFYIPVPVSFTELDT